MKILVMSDTHGWDDNAAEAVKREDPVDGLIHAGDLQETEAEFRRYSGIGKDIPAYFAEGNCDQPGRFPDEQVIEIAGHRILLAHGHELGVSFGTSELLYEARARQCDVAICGHTHRPVLDESDPKVLILNPGSMTFPRQQGREPTYIVLTLFLEQPPKAELKSL